MNAAKTAQTMALHAPTRSHLAITRLEVVLIAVAMLIAGSLCLIGINWALPSAARSHYYPAAMRWYEMPKGPERLYWTAPFEPYHPDESFLLDALSNMAPERLDFNPHFFNYPTLQIYLTGAVLKAGEQLGLLQVVNSKAYYVEHPEAMARLYVVGRLLAAAMAVGTVAALYLTTRWLFGAAVAWLSALALAVTPLWVRDAHFMLINVPGAFWMTAAAGAAVLAAQNHSRRWLVASAALAGLSASTKYPAGAVLVLAGFALFRQPGLSRIARVWWLLGLGTVAGAFFVLGTPYAVLSPGEFLQALLFEGGTKLGFLSLSQLAALFVVGLGTGLAVLAAGGLVLALAHWRDWRFLFVLLWLVLGLAQILMSGAELLRYMIQALPPLAVLAGLAMDAVRRHAAARWSAAAGWGLASVLLAPTLLYSANVVALMTTPDIRDQAAAWLASHVAPGEQVGICGSLYFDKPPINAEVYDIVQLEQGPQAVPPVVVLTSLAQPCIALEAGTGRQHVFAKRPWLLWTWPVAHLPHDWQYTFHEIVIYEQATPAAHASD